METPASLAATRCAQAPSPPLLVAGSRHRVYRCSAPASPRPSVPASPRRTPFPRRRSSQQRIRVVHPVLRTTFPGAAAPDRHFNCIYKLTFCLGDNFCSYFPLRRTRLADSCGGLGAAENRSVAAADGGEPKQNRKLGFGIIDSTTQICSHYACSQRLDALVISRQWLLEGAKCHGAAEGRRNPTRETMGRSLLLRRAGSSRAP